MDNTKLFREKSIETIESPEALNDYLRVTSPGIWLILGAVVLFLTGVCIWGVFGHIDSTMDTAVVAQDGGVDCLVPKEAISGVLENPAVEIDDINYALKPSTLEPEIISEDTDIYVLLTGNLEVGQIVYRIPVDASLEEGTYSGKVVTEKLTPISLLLN